VNLGIINWRVWENVPQFHTHGQWLHQSIRCIQPKKGLLLTGPNVQRIYRKCGSASNAEASLPGTGIT